MKISSISERNNQHGDTVKISESSWKSMKANERKWKRRIRNQKRNTASMAEENSNQWRSCENNQIIEASNKCNNGVKKLISVWKYVIEEEIIKWKLASWKENRNENNQ